MADPYWSNVELLVHADTSIADVSPVGRSLTVTGATVNTSIKKFGAGSMSVDGGSVSCGAFTLPGNFTFEMWAYVDPATSAPLFSVFDADSELDLYVDPSGCYLYDLAIDGNRLSITGAVSTGWHHVAWTRSGGVHRIFVDGAQGGSGTWADSTSYAFTDCWISGGFIDEVRATIGVARYTSDFAVPTEAFWTGSSGAGAAAGVASSSFVGRLHKATTGASSGSSTCAGASSNATPLPGWGIDDAQSATGSWSLSPDRLTATATKKGEIRGTPAKTTGKWYFEIGVSTSSNQLLLGVANNDVAISYNSTFDLYAAPPVWQQTSGDGAQVFGFAFDADTGQVWYHADGFWPTGNPAVPEDQFPESIGTGGAPLTPVAINRVNSTQSFVGRFTTASFAYTAPDGFAPLYGASDTSMTASAVGASTGQADASMGRAGVAAAASVASSSYAGTRGGAGAASSAGVASAGASGLSSALGAAAAGGLAAALAASGAISRAVGSSAGSSSVLAPLNIASEGSGIAQGLAALLGAVGARTKFRIGPTATTGAVLVSVRSTNADITAQTEETATI